MDYLKIITEEIKSNPDIIFDTNSTCWSIERLKALGLPIKRNALKPYKEYILMTYKKGLRRGLKKKIKTKLFI